MNGNVVVTKAYEFLGNTNGAFFNEKYYGKKQKNIYAWCCMFVWYIFHLVGYDNIFYGGKKCAGCTTLLNFYKTKYPSYVDTDLSKCKAGDLVFYQFDKDYYADHIGIFDTKLSDNVFVTIEGNTTYEEGGKYGVFQKQRNINNVMAFVHLPFNNEPVYDKYIVKKGDTLWGLAKRYYGNGLKWTTISKYNNLKSTVIKVGQVLYIPKEGV